MLWQRTVLVVSFAILANGQISEIIGDMVGIGEAILSGFGIIGDDPTLTKPEYPIIDETIVEDLPVTEEEPVSPVTEVEPILQVKRYECDLRGQIIPSTYLTTYYVCEEDIDTLKPVKHECEAQEIYNTTVQGCYSLRGGGRLGWVEFNDSKTCSEDDVPLRYYDWEMWRHYTLCQDGRTIIAVCEVGWYFNEETGECQQEDVIATTLITDDMCAGKATTLVCRQPGIFPIGGNAAEEAAISGDYVFSTGDECSNCYYECHPVAEYTFELFIICINESKLENETKGEETEGSGDEEENKNEKENNGNVEDKTGSNCSTTFFEGSSCDEEGLFRYRNSCTLYYRCYHSEECGKMVQSDLQLCPQCLKFNAKIGRCDYPQKVSECTYDSGEKRNCSAPGNYPVPNDCRKYYECIEGKPLAVKNCSDGKIFDEESGKCVEGDGCPLTNECSSDEWLYDKYDCGQYYRCFKHQNEWEMGKFKCPIEEIFNGAYCEPKEDSFLGDWDAISNTVFVFAN